MSLIRLRKFHIVPVLIMLLAGMRIGVNAQEGLEGLIFRDALQVCLAAVDEGDLGKAAALFERLEQMFGGEAEYLDEVIQRHVLPVKGMAELAAGKPLAAIDTLERVWKQYPDLFSENHTLIYSLAQAYKKNQNLEKSRQALKFYLDQFPGDLETGFAYLERADLYFQEGLIDEGLEGLEQFYRSELPQSLKMQGQLKAVHACLQNGRKDQATQLMLQTDWSVSAMPELAQLTFSALETAEYAMAENRTEDALKLFYLAPPKTTLVQLQRQRIEELKQSLAYSRVRTRVKDGSHRQQYLTQMLRKLEQQLKALETTGDYTPTFYLKYGQSLMLDSQFYRAWLVFEYIALEEAYPADFREEAHYRWVLTACRMEDWEEALTIARNFVSRYPDSHLAPQALYLIARAHLEQRRFQESYEVLTDLADSFPNHALFPRWLFTRGFVQILLEDYPPARRDFAAYLLRFPDGALKINAGLWDALTYFFEKNYATCADMLTTLSRLAQNHPLYPEIQFRLASTHYASRSYDEARSTINRYLGEFPRHFRVGEARVLKGDILMGKGELEEALNTFSGIEPEVGDLYLYSVFQAGKILRALQEYADMVSHFNAFLQNEEAPRVRLSEALYWLGWAYQQQGALDQAFPIFERALATYGDDTKSAETGSILKALQNLKGVEAAAKYTGEVGRQSALVEAENFSSWILHEIRTADQNNQLTYYTRLVLFFIEQVRQPETTELSYQALAQRVPLEKMDAESLGRVGLALLDAGDERARNFFEQLLDGFPSSPARSMAYLGLAKLDFAAGDYPATKAWLHSSNDKIPMHARMNETQLLLGRTLSQLNLFGESIAAYEKLLRRKSARGRAHAQALDGIAESYTRSGAIDKAIAYYQRIYNMYRAYPDLVSSAYWKSANLFEAADRLPEAVATLREMLSQPKLKGLPEWGLAEARLELLLPLLPEEPTISEGEGGTANEN